MPKYQSKSKVKRGQALVNYWQLEISGKFHSGNLGKDPSTESNALRSSTTIVETHVPFGMAVDEDTSSPDITVATFYNYEYQSIFNIVKLNFVSWCPIAH
ncbi:unnamed protein product [Parnassius apollo]|uniref:(apollo) hypothetical protein n=1 Tax=Parnassius apollo TaxID=110799 RepID=A0A8S3XPV6_PARAO|nr:unnamed protein product [Parnassius apollo]